MQVTITPSTIDHYKLIREGMEYHGLTVYESNSPQTKTVVCWGWRKGKEFLRAGHDVLVFERAYLGDRHYYTSIGWNGLNGHADFCLSGKEELKGNWSLKPWRDGKYIVIAGQVPGDQSLKDQDMTSLYEKWAYIAEKYYKMPVYYKPHPNARRGNFSPKIPLIDGDMDEVLSKCHLLLCYNSNSSVDAVINGVPCVTFDDGSMARSVTGHSIEERIKPDREKWLAGLSNCQWTPEEIRRGDYIERMLCR